MKELYAGNATRMAKRLIEVSEYLKTSGETILVFPHKSVDGDCVGSSCAAVMLFRKLGAKAYVCMPEKLPENMSFMNVEDLLFYPEEGFKAGDMVNGSPFTRRMSVDCSEGHRMGRCCEIFDSCTEVALDVDHHEVIHLADDYKWIEPKASSASELMYYVAVAISQEINVELKELLSNRAAQCLLTGIVTDTGRFSYSNTRPESLEASGVLMDLGGNITDICYNLFDCKKKAEFYISNTACVNAELYYNDKMAITYVTEKMFSEFGADKEDIGDVVSRLRDIDSVELAVVLREVEGGVVRGNLRSQTHFDCAEFASVYNGGGHKRAAGFTVEGMSIEEVKADVIRRVEGLL